MLTFMYLAYTRVCYAAATSLGMGWVGGRMLTFMYLAYTRGCYAAATSLGMGGVGGDVNVHVPCVHTWMLRCCYDTGHGWGGGDVNVHVPCVHTWMLRCCYVKSAAASRGLPFQNVIHQVKNFTSDCTKVWPEVSTVAGTQTLDRSWRSLKTFLPKGMTVKQKIQGHSCMHPSVPQYM